MYINKIKENNFWTWDFELSQTIFLYNINIAVFISKYNSHSYKFKFYENNTTINNNLPLLLSYDQNIDHYQLLT